MALAAAQRVCRVANSAGVMEWSLQAWETWESLEDCRRVVDMLREGKGGGGEIEGLVGADTYILSLVGSLVGNGRGLLVLF